MTRHIFRNPIPEDLLTGEDLQLRYTKFKELDRDLHNIRGDVRAHGPEKRASARHLKMYASKRRELLDQVAAHAVLRRRVERPIGAKWEAGHILARAVRRVGKLAADDADKQGGPLDANDKRTQRLIAWIAARQKAVNKMLDDIGIDAESELRPASCLPGDHQPEDEQGPERDSKRVIGKSPTTERYGAMILQVQEELRQLHAEGLPREAAIRRWIANNPESVIAEAFKYNESEVLVQCKAESNGGKFVRNAIYIVMVIANLQYDTLRRYWTTYAAEHNIR